MPQALKDSDCSSPLCPTCGYNLTGLPEERCPECGNTFDARMLAHRRESFWPAGAEQMLWAPLIFSLLPAWIVTCESDLGRDLIPSALEFLGVLFLLATSGCVMLAAAAGMAKNVRRSNRAQSSVIDRIGMAVAAVICQIILGVAGFMLVAYVLFSLGGRFPTA